MTIEQLERKVHDLEAQVNELRRGGMTQRSRQMAERTFGMFEDDPEFDEIVRLGREYREKANSLDD